jgi:CHAD domain-containing protein
MGGDPEGVHQLRVSGRRLRLALSLLTHGPGGRRIARARRTVQRIGDAAGRARDLRVALEALDAHVRSASEPSPHWITLRRRLRAGERRATARMAEVFFDLDIARLRQALRDATSSGLVDPERVRQDLRSRASRQGAVLATEIAHDRRFDVERLHDRRRRARRLRYLAEIDAEVAREDLGASRRFKEIQDRLGAIRDAWLLYVWLRDAAARGRRRGEHALAWAASRLAGKISAETKTEFRRWTRTPAAEALMRGLRRMGVRTPRLDAVRAVGRARRRHARS